MSKPKLDDFLRAARTFYAPGALEGAAYREAPETMRYQEAWTAALAKHNDWQALVSKIQSELPESTVGDTTAPGAMAARRCCVYMTLLGKIQPAKPYSIIVGLASVLVPYYHIYQVVVDIQGGVSVRGSPLARPREGAEGATAELISRHLERELGLEEFPPEYEPICIQDIVVRNLPPGQATLLDALFDDDRANIP